MISLDNYVAGHVRKGIGQVKGKSPSYTHTTCGILWQILTQGRMADVPVVGPSNGG